MATHTIVEQLGVRQIKEDVFTSLKRPLRMGNALPIAFGGCTIGVAISAACQTVTTSMQAYSVLGHFLGPAQTDRDLVCRVLRVRDTKTFATRRVVTEQTLDDGSTRTCLELTVDFQLPEPRSMMVYTVSPVRQYSGVDGAATADEVFASLLTEGALRKSDRQKFEAMFGSATAWLEQKYCLEGVSGQNLGGFAKNAWTTMDHLPITQKTSAEWNRLKEEVPPQHQTAVLGFFMDQGLSFLPLSHDHQFLEDAGACSTLDFALRIFSPSLNLQEWHLRERKTVVGDAGRTYSEGQLFNSEGRLVASMTQQSILRPKKPKVRSSL